MKNRMKTFKEKIQQSHLCPYCHESIGFVRKFFCYNGWHFKPCPHCNRKIKVKTLSPILAAIYALLAITVISSVFFAGDLWLLVLSVILLLFTLLGELLLPFVPMDSNDDDQKAE